MSEDNFNKKMQDWLMGEETDSKKLLAKEKIKNLQKQSNDAKLRGLSLGASMTVPEMPDLTTSGYESFSGLRKLVKPSDRMPASDPMLNPLPTPAEPVEYDEKGDPIMKRIKVVR